MFEVLFDNPIVVRYPIFWTPKAPKWACPKDRCCSSAEKKDIQLQSLPILKMNCADSTERPLNLKKAMPLSQLFEVLFDSSVVVKYPIFWTQKAKNRYAKKKDIQLQNLPISKMNCADSTERPLKLPEPVFHCVDIFHHQPDNIDVPSRIPAHEELSGCF